MEIKLTLYPIYQKKIVIINKENSVVYYDSSWFGNEINLKNFWDPTQYFSDGISDSLRIYIIDPEVGNDSVLIRRVHRFFMPGREG